MSLREFVSLRFLSLARNIRNNPTTGQILLEELYNQYVEKNPPRNTDEVPVLSPNDYHLIKTVAIDTMDRRSSNRSPVTTCHMPGFSTTSQLTECIMRHLSKRRKPTKIICSKAFLRRRASELYVLRGKAFTCEFTIWLEGEIYTFPLQTDENLPVNLDENTVIAVSFKR